MPSVEMIMNGEGCWPDLQTGSDNDRLYALFGDDAPPIQLALLRGGMTSGKSSVSIRIDLPDGKVVLTETSLALLRTAIRGFVAATGETD